MVFKSKNVVDWHTAHTTLDTSSDTKQIDHRLKTSDIALQCAQTMHFS